MRSSPFLLITALALAGCGQRDAAQETAAPAPQAAVTAEQADEAPLPVAAPVAAGDAEPDVGRLKYAANCLSCHGASGQGMGPFPKLAGQSADEIAGKLRDYRAGKTVGAQTATMVPFAKALSEAEVDAVARYIATF